MSGLNKRLLLKNLEEGHIYFFEPTATISSDDFFDNYKQGNITINNAEIDDVSFIYK